MNIADLIRKERIIAIARNIPKEYIMDLSAVLSASGVLLLEVTFDQSSEAGIDNALESMKALTSQTAKRFAVGAGTVMTTKQVEQAADAGARYVLSPGLDLNVVKRTKELGMISIPGAMTPSEISTAWDHGADFVKVFPASVLTPGFFKAVRGPLPHIPLLATGGITPDNLADYLKAGALGAGVGGNLVSLDLIKRGDLDKIRETARRYLEVINHFENP